MTEHVRGTKRFRLQKSQSLTRSCYRNEWSTMRLQLHKQKRVKDVESIARIYHTFESFSLLKNNFNHFLDEYIVSKRNQFGLNSWTWQNISSQRRCSRNRRCFMEESILLKTMHARSLCGETRRENNAKYNEIISAVNNACCIAQLSQGQSTTKSFQP